MTEFKTVWKKVVSFSEHESSPKGLKLTEPEVLCVLNYRRFRVDAVLDNVSVMSLSAPEAEKVSRELPDNGLSPGLWGDRLL